jgi:23S rRNA (uracil1939-C5)-methyltransferase
MSGGARSTQPDSTRRDPTPRDSTLRDSTPRDSTPRDSTPRDPTPRDSTLPAPAQPAPPTGDLTAVTIDGIAAGGAGVGRLPDGRAIFVHRTAPGDTARVAVTMARSRWARGELRAVEAPGPGRRKAPCAHYRRCGGCTLQHLEAEVQQESRRRLVREALVRIGKLEGLPEVEFHAPGPEFGYRNRASFTLRRLGRRSGAGAPPPVVAGFHALERPGHVVDVGTDAGGPCLLLEPALRELWDGVRRAWGPDARHLPAGAELRLTLRALDDGTGVLLVEGGGGEGKPQLLLDAVPGLRAVWTRPRDGDAPRLLAGDATPTERWFDDAFPVRPGAFLQVNRSAATVLHELALAELAPEAGDRVIDAYAGYGVYGRAAARAGAQAVGIELDPGAVAMGRDRPVPGFELVEGAVEDVLPDLLPADRVLLNPPRAGVADGVMESLGVAPPRRLVYVSCDPATLARDLARLGPGFTVRRIQAVDLFPQTAHVETVVTLDMTRTNTT